MPTPLPIKDENSIYEAVKKAKTEGKSIVAALKENIHIEEIDL